MPKLEYVSKLLEAINKGHKTGGAKVLKHYLTSLKTGEKPKEGTENFVIRCLSKIVTDYENGKLPDYDDIFCMGQRIVKKRGPKSMSETMHIRREELIGSMFYKLREIYNYDEAIAIMIKELEHGMSKETIEEYLALWNKEE